MADEKQRYGLPENYPFNEEGFREDQAANARWYRFQGPTDQTVSVSLVPGEVYELWPGGTLFNSAGSCIGHLNMTVPPEDADGR